jgi:AmmeMemoRadiSam system protein A
VAAPLTSEDRELLLRLARQAIVETAEGRPLPALETAQLPEHLLGCAATFVTLTRRGGLRGCIGALQAQLPLAEDVRQHARAAASEDFRFIPVTPQEVPELEIEISILTDPSPLEFSGSDDLLARLRPGIDGVILVSGLHRATFLPQVWEKVADAESFLSMLCEKAGLPASAWRKPGIEIFTYRVESFHEGQAHPA